MLGKVKVNEVRKIFFYLIDSVKKIGIGIWDAISKIDIFVFFVKLISK